MDEMMKMPKVVRKLPKDTAPEASRWDAASRLKHELMGDAVGRFSRQG